MIPDDVVERVREHADIVQIVGELVKLKRSGSSYRGPCPFHQGKDPNFSVSPKGGYHCFVCHEKGDVFTFVQKRMGLDFVDAVKYVGAKAGVEVHEVSRDKAVGPDPRERFWGINAAAADFFSRALWGEEGGAAREYLASRELDRPLAERFGLGFAPRDGGALRTYLESLGYDAATLVTAGFLVVREESEDPRPRFRSRLMFPIYDVQGHVVAFGGRVIGQGEPKYLNSPESPTFQKGSTLYGLNWAKSAIRRDQRALLVEGYFDCVRLMAAGVESVVAPLGTALTEAQAEMIQRLSANVFLLYDSDMAGLKATFRAGDLLLSRGCKVLVVTLPEGEDPDTFVRHHGRDGLERHLSGAIDILERKLKILELGGWFGDLRRKRTALDRLLPTIRAASDPITRSLYLARVAEAVGLAPDVLEREVRNPGRRVEGSAGPSRRAERAVPADAPPSRAPSVTRGSRERGVRAERELVRVLVHRRQNIERAAERVGASDFRDPMLSQIFAALVEHRDGPLDALATVLDEEVVGILDELAAADGGLDDPVRMIEDCVAVLKRRTIDEELYSIDRDMSLASDAEKDQLVRKKQDLMREFRELGGRRWKSFGEARP